MPKHSVPKQRGRAIQTARSFKVLKKPSKKVLQKKMEDKKLYLYWLKQWADHEYPGAQGDDTEYFEGTFEDIMDDRTKTTHRDFVEKTLFPGMKKCYVTMSDEKGYELTSSFAMLPFGNVIDWEYLQKEYDEQEVVIRFDPEKLISKIHYYLSRSEMQEHYTALEDCGWDVDEWENGKRAVYRS